jgi:hypothetical protein
MVEPARRLLIVSGAEAASVEHLPAHVRELIENAADVLVVAPVLPSKLRLWTNDTDHAREQADERLATILGQVATPDTDRPVAGVVGDEVPLTAFDDAVRLFSPDQILIGLRGDTHASWQEEGLLGQVRQRFQIPITIVEIDEAGRVTASGRLEASPPAGS